MVILKIKGKFAQTISYIFQALLVSYLVLLLVEQVWSTSVSSYFNLNYLLIIVIVLGGLDVFAVHNKPQKEKVNWKDYTFIGVLGVLGFIIIKFKTDPLGWLSWLISIIAGVLIVLLSLLVLEEDDED